MLPSSLTWLNFLKIQQKTWITKKIFKQNIIFSRGKPFDPHLFLQRKTKMDVNIYFYSGKKSANFTDSWIVFPKSKKNDLNHRLIWIWMFLVHHLSHQMREVLGIVPFVSSHLMGRFFVFFTVAFLLFLAPAGGSNPAGPIT